MKEQNPHEFASATDGLTEAQIERARKRVGHGDILYGKAVGPTSADWLHYSECREKLTSSERATFDLEFIKARAVAGVRPAVDLALAAMRRKLMLRLGRGRWGRCDRPGHRRRHQNRVGTGRARERPPA